MVHGQPLWLFKGRVADNMTAYSKKYNYEYLGRFLISSGLTESIPIASFDAGRLL
jgi:hypothetical protein